jgi:hypothetical protein
MAECRDATCRCVVPVLLFCRKLLGQADPTVPLDLQRAGTNRTAWEQALRDVPQAQRKTLEFLMRQMPDHDARSLDAAFLLRQVELAHRARAAVPWGSALDDAMFLGFVVPYAQGNERREDWRTDFVARFLPTVLDCKTPGEAARRLNETIFDTLNVHYSTGRARADQAPSESIAQGKASCTGLSILLANACRACAVPARLVSVVWPHKAGNHTWVEVWDGAQWRFVGADEPDPAGLDRGWFVGDAAQAAAASEPRHRPWAVSFAATGTKFAAGWGRGIELWGIDRSDAYRTPTADGDAALAGQLDRWFAAGPAERATFAFDRNLDAELRTAAGDARLRALVWAALQRHEAPQVEAARASGRLAVGEARAPFVLQRFGKVLPAPAPLLVVAIAPALDGHALALPADVVDAATKAAAEGSSVGVLGVVLPDRRAERAATVERAIRHAVVGGEAAAEMVFWLDPGSDNQLLLDLPHRFAALVPAAALPRPGQLAARLQERRLVVEPMLLAAGSGPELRRGAAEVHRQRDDYTLRVAAAGVEFWWAAGSSRVTASAAGRRNLAEALVGAESVALPLRRAAPEPSLRTLCATMVRAGDPQLAASWVWPLD